jgi:hypothetical protein
MKEEEMEKETRDSLSLFMKEGWENMSAGDFGDWKFVEQWRPGLYTVIT